MLFLHCRDLDADGMCCRFSGNADKLAVGLSNGDIKVRFWLINFKGYLFSFLLELRTLSSCCAMIVLITTLKL